MCSAAVASLMPLAVPTMAWLRSACHLVPMIGSGPHLLPAAVSLPQPSLTAACKTKRQSTPQQKRKTELKARLMIHFRSTFKASGWTCDSYFQALILRGTTLSKICLPGVQVVQKTHDPCYSLGKPACAATCRLDLTQQPWCGNSRLAHLQTLTE